MEGGKDRQRIGSPLLYQLLAAFSRMLRDIVFEKVSGGVFFGGGPYGHAGSPDTASTARRPNFRPETPVSSGLAPACDGFPNAQSNESLPVSIFSACFFRVCMLLYSGRGPGSPKSPRPVRETMRNDSRCGGLNTRQPAIFPVELRQDAKGRRNESIEVPV